MLYPANFGSALLQLEKRHVSMTDQIIGDLQLNQQLSEATLSRVNASGIKDSFVQHLKNCCKATGQKPDGSIHSMKELDKIF